MAKWLRNTQVVFALFTFAMIPLGAGSESRPSPAQQVMWDKMKLEEILQSRLKQAISPMVPKGAVVVKVDITIEPYEEQGNSERSAQSAQTAKAGEGIEFTKLGLTAPVLDLAEQPVNTKTLPSLFDLITEVTTTITLDVEGFAERKETIQKLATNLLGEVGSVTPTVTLEQGALIPKEKVKEEKKEIPWDGRRWMIELKNVIGGVLAVLLGVLMMGIFALLISRQHRNLEAKKIKLMEESGQREATALTTHQEKAREEPKEKEDVKQEGSHAAAAMAHAPMEGATSSTHSPVNEAFDRYTALVKSSPERAASLVKQWLKVGADTANSALAILPEKLGDDEFKDISSRLSLDQRKQWRKIMLARRVEASPEKAAQFINLQILENAFSSGPTMDSELKDRLSDLELDDCVAIAIIQGNVEIAAVLSIILPTSLVARMFSKLDSETATAITLASIRLSDQDIQASLSNVKKVVNAYLSGKNVIALPFLEKASELLATAMPEKEKPLFDAIISSCDYVALELAAQQYYPAELVTQLPGKTVRAIFDKLPPSRKAEVLVALDQATRDQFLGYFGKPGDKARELIDVEVSQTQSDPVKSVRIQKNKEQIWKHFIEHTRKQIRTNEAIGEVASAVLSQWLYEKSEGVVGAQLNDRAKVA